MAACSSEIDDKVFMRWPRSASPSTSADATRREELRQDFKRQFCSQAAAAESTPKHHPRKVKAAAAAAKPAAKPAPPCVGGGPAAVDSRPAGPRHQAAREPGLRHLRLLSPSSRAIRWQHTTWHHMPPHPDTSRGNCRASHYAVVGQEDCGHFRIHPDWGYDVPAAAAAADS